MTEEVPLSDMIQDKQTLTAICRELYGNGKRSWIWIFQDWNGRREAGLKVADRLQQFYITAIQQKWKGLMEIVEGQVCRTKYNYKQYYSYRKGWIKEPLYKYRLESRTRFRATNTKGSRKRPRKA